MATVRFSRGHWVADYYDSNKRRRIERPRGHFENLTDELRAAQALLADRVAEVAEGLVHQGLGTFEDAATRWLNSKVAIRPSTRRIYRQLLVGYLVPYFGDRTLRLIQVTDIERFRTELSAGIPDSIKQALIARVLAARPGHAEARAKQRANRLKISTRSINKALSVLSMVFNYAMRNQWVTRNPARYVEPARDHRPLEERPLDMDVLTPEEVAAVREAAIPATYRGGKLITNNYRLLLSFAVFTGCRAGEILGAAWNHIDWVSGEFRVRRAYREGHFQEPKTRTSYRNIALPGFLLEELKVWRRACPQSPHDLIFPNLDGRPMSYSRHIPGTPNLSSTHSWHTDPIPRLRSPLCASGPYARVPVRSKASSPSGAPARAIAKFDRASACPLQSRRLTCRRLGGGGVRGR